jgi:hypothetical protein
VDLLTPVIGSPNIGSMQRLSGLDASFLYLETAAQPLHVCSILELDTATMPGGYTFDRLRDELAMRVKAMPEFREKLADSRLNLDHPVWVEDPDFDVQRHLHRIGCPHPGAAPSCRRSAVTSPPCRWTAAVRCGRCGSSRTSRAPTRTPAGGWHC